MNWLLLVLLTIAGGNLQAEEEYEKFLGALKQLGADRGDPTYFQIAYDYLEYLEGTDLISDTIKASLSYQKGTLLIASARYIKSKQQREKVLVDGKALLEKFIQENEYHPSVPAAKNEMANLLILTARQKIEEDAGRNTSLVKSARDDFQAAGQIVVETREALAEQLKKLPVNPTDPLQRQRRTEFENEFLRARLMLPSIQEEVSDTYPVGSDARKISLEAAVKEFTDVNKDYRFRTAGQVAWIYRGRCLEKLGQPKEAIAAFREIFEQPDSTEFRELKRMALELAFPIWLDEAKTENGFIEAVKVTEPIINTLTPQESRSTKWLTVRLDLAKAYRKYYDYLVAKAEKTPEEKIQQTQALQQANAAARFVASSSSDLKREAQQLMVEWGVRADVDPESVEPPKDFVEARDRAATVLAELEILRKTVSSLEEELAGNPANREELVARLNEANQSLVETPQKAIDLLQMAIGFSSADTPIGDINLIRYQMCFCYYTMKDYFRAALIGEFLLDRFPSLNGSRESAAIAMYSYWDLYQSATGDDKKFEEQKVDKICSKIVSTWPAAAEAAEATRMLIAIAIDSGQLERAVELLDRIPDDSTHKASIALNTGQAFWVSYLAKKKTAEDAGNLNAELPQLIAMRDQAESLLADGISTLDGSNLSVAKAKSALALAKIYAEKEQGEKNLAILEHPDYGLLKLAREKAPVAADSRFRLDVFRTALTGYVNSINTTSDAGTIATTMDKASAIMGDLKQLTSEMENGDRLLVSLYYSFANDIKTKMDSIRSLEARKNFSDGLSQFLQGAATSSSDFQVIMWAGSTLIRIADSFSEQGEQEEATELYQAAAKVIDQIKERKIEVSADDQMAVLRNHGKALAGQGDFEQALPKFIEYLAARPATLDVQIDAALALQNAGQAKQDPSKLAQAIMGGGEYKDPESGKAQKAIWGWGKLSLAIANRPQFKDQYLTARYNLAKSRLLYHQIKANPRLVELALSEVESAREKYPDLGGPEMKARFDKLTADLQAAQ